MPNFIIDQPYQKEALIFYMLNFYEKLKYISILILKKEQE